MGPTKVLYCLCNMMTNTISKQIENKFNNNARFIKIYCSKYPTLKCRRSLSVCPGKKLSLGSKSYLTYSELFFSAGKPAGNLRILTNAEWEGISY